MTRADMPSDPAAVVRALRACRDVMIDVCRQVRPMGPTYHGASMVKVSIDAFATLLTGQRDYFWADGSSASEGRLTELEDKAARERGEKPWEG